MGCGNTAGSEDHLHRQADHFLILITPTATPRHSRPIRQAVSAAPTVRYICHLVVN